MFQKILIANRGEIALRILRACKELGIKTVAVHSQADEDALHVRFADESVCIGPAESKRSYLHIPSIISAAEITNSEAIHPGYGFLAEDPHFAEVCQSCHLTFIGPTPATMRLLGDKAKARQFMEAAGIPVLPGSEAAVSGEEEALAVARRIGFPVMLKSCSGGGGLGLRIIRSEDDWPNCFGRMQSEVAAAFGHPQLYVERYVDRSRHIEFQILADSAGHLIHLGERDCSIQRRHQKLVEESPSPEMDEALRQEMGEVAIRAAAAAGYINAGTVEFLLDQDHRYYFIEMNSRIQVEHPVTEMVTGVDLIKEQIRIAAGEKLNPYGQRVPFSGHSIECRINAEDPDKFSPAPGLITALHLPGGHGIRVDTAIHTHCTILPHYDSLIAKLIVHGRDRPEAIAKMRRCLEEIQIEGITTLIPFHRRVLTDERFVGGKYDTGFVEGMEQHAEEGKTG